MAMKAEIVSPSANISKQLTFLYQQAGWLEPSDHVDIVKLIVSNTYAFAIVRDDSNIVAMGRAISDGVSDAYIQDVYVDQNYRKRGLGKLIINTLLEHLQKNNIMWIGLIGNPGTEDFYRPLGFEPMADYMPIKYSRKNHVK